VWETRVKRGQGRMCDQSGIGLVATDCINVNNAAGTPQFTICTPTGAPQQVHPPRPSARPPTCVRVLDGSLEVKVHNVVGVVSHIGLVACGRQGPHKAGVHSCQSVQPHATSGAPSWPAWSAVQMWFDARGLPHPALNCPPPHGHLPSMRSLASQPATSGRACGRERGVGPQSKQHVSSHLTKNIEKNLV
jgi:hypothetical protein